MTERPEYMPGQWEYMGDVNLEYGGLFVKLPEDGDDWIEVCEVVDLDSATGADGLVLIERKTVYGIFDKDKIESTLQCCGETVKSFRGMSKTAIMIELAYTFNSYGYVDQDDGWANYRMPSYLCIVGQDYGGNKQSWDGWKVDREETVRLHKQYNGELKAYVESVWLD